MQMYYIKTYNIYVCMHACSKYRENKTEIRIGCHEKHTACIRVVSYNRCSRMKMGK
jgi:hypothetical protein